MTKKAIFQLIESLLVIALLAFFYLKDLPTVAFHIDESHWIGTSYMFEAYFKGEFSSEAWRDNQHTVTNPPVPRYVIGVSRFLAGYRIPDLNRAWDYTRNRNFNLRMGAMPTDALLWWSRLPMALLTVLSLWMGFLFLKTTSGRPAAYIWIIFGIASSFLLLQTRRAMAEASILFFVMLAAWLCWHALKTLEGQPARAYLYLALSGLCIGLAGEAKMNGLSVMAGIMPVALLVIWRQHAALGSKLWRGLLVGVLVTLTAALAFFGTYPYLWPDPLGRTVHVFENRVDEMKYQTTQHAPDAINSPAQRLTIIPARIFDDYAVLHFPGALFLNLALTLLGAGILLAQLWQGLKNDGDISAVATLLAVAVTASVPSFFTLLDWDRYYLFPIFFSSMAIAVALGWLLQKGYHQVRQMRLNTNK